MDPEIFSKPVFNVGATSSFLKDIWYPPEIRNQRTVVYNEYTCTKRRRTSNYLNDFVSHRTYLSAELSSDQIQAIHENNIQHATSGGTHSATKNSLPFSSSKQDAFAEWSPDDLLTDSLMDKFNIIPGKRQERVQHFYLQSRILFLYLAMELGSEKIVKLRRRLMKCKFLSEFIVGSNKSKLIVRGSRSEGLNMKGSDTDILVEMGQVFQKREENHTNLFYDNMSGTPGYVTVGFIHEGTHYIVSSDMVKKRAIQLFNFFKCLKSFNIHGPSLATGDSGEDFDYVPCLTSDDWPNEAQEWIFRKRKHGWPSQEMINSFVELGCHIVPVGNKAKHKDEVEWRLSFSEAEEELILSFNHVQLMIYGLLKILLKEVFKPHAKTSELLCSYFMKTVMFWVIEETHSSIWTSKYTILCFDLCLKRLIHFVKEEYCPNFFIPENNMFANRFSKLGKEHILENLCRISASGLKWNSPSMLQLERYLINPKAVDCLRIESGEKMAREKCELASELKRFCRLAAVIFSTGIGKTIVTAQYFKSTLGNNASSQVCHFIDIARCKSVNKKTYILQKLFYRLLLNNCHEDLISGKALLATWLYNQGRNRECIQVVEHALESLKFRMVYISDKHTHFVRPDNSVLDCNKVSFSDILCNFNLLSSCFVPIPFNSVFMPKEIGDILSSASSFLKDISIFNSGGFMFFPETYCYFLKCLCYLSQGNIASFNKEYAKMEGVKTICSDDENLTHTIYGLVLKFTLYHQKVNNKNYDEIPTSDINEHITIFGSLFSGVNSILNNPGSLGINMDIFREQMLAMNGRLALN